MTTAFQVLDRKRARVLRAVRQRNDARAALSPTDRATFDRVSLQLSRLQLATLASPRESERRALWEAYERVERQAHHTTAGAWPEESETRPLDLDPLKRLLRAQQRTLVSYLIDDDGGVAFVLTADTLVAVPLEATRARVRRQLANIGSPWNGQPPDPAFALPPLYDLYRDLVAPLRRWVTTTAVTIVPDTDIATVPFAALLTAPSTTYDTDRYLVREWSITVDQAAWLVGAQRPRRDKPIDVLALGRSTFEAERSTWNTPYLFDLPEVVEEVGSATRRGSARQYLNGRATEARLKQLASKARVIHIASHAEATEGHAMLGHIKLGPGEGEDGNLYMHEILGADFDADLVVLSGCSTARGEIRDGEGQVGLQYGVRAAGARATVAMGWPVSDGATADLMRRFYNGLGRGLGKDDALRQAQLTYLEGSAGIEASPFYWAAPVLYGAPDPVQLEPGIGWPFVALAAIAALTGGLAWRALPHPDDG